MNLTSAATWQQFLAVVDFEGIPGPLSFYVAKAVNETTIELHHRDETQPPLVIDAVLFGWRYRSVRETSVDPDRTGLIFDVLRGLLPPLCEACGHVVPAGSCCPACQERQVTDLLRMSDPMRSAI